jgi:hypothetical protein
MLRAPPELGRYTAQVFSLPFSSISKSRSAMSSHDCIPGFAREVLALFAGPLSKVRFPDLDAALLEQHAGLVEAAHAEVLQLEEQLAQARARVQEEAQALTGVAQRAIAYARIYAEGKSDLEARVAAVCERKASQPAEPTKKRTRNRRSDADTSLFDIESQGDDAAQLM